MRTPTEVRRVERLITAGLNNCEIARETGVPRATVGDWRAGRVPRDRDWVAGRSCPACGHNSHRPSQLPGHDYAYLLGMYLGDGSIARAPRGVYKLRIACDMHYPAIISEVSAAMISVLPASRVRTVWRQGGGWGAEVYAYSKAWPCLFPQHGRGPKHRRSIGLVPWQARIVDNHPKPFIRGLLHSDGCRVANRVNGRDYPRYFFTQVSEDIRGLFCGCLDRLEIHYTRPSPRNVSIARKRDVARLDAFVGPKA